MNLQTTGTENASGKRVIMKGLSGFVKLLLMVYAILTLYPLYWLFTSAFKSNQDFFTNPYGLPKEWMTENIFRAWELGNMGRAMINSTVVTITAVALTILLSVLAAYVLSRFEFRFKKLVVVLFTTGLLIPIHSTLVPLFIMMKNIGLLDTYGALILPYTAFELPIAIFLAMAYMSSIPREIEEAAMIDGSGWWGIFSRMILPLCTPIVATISILAFLRFWNDFSFALVFINTQALKTLPLSLSLFSDGFGTDYALTMGAMAIAVIPTIVAYLILQEQIMKGMVAGSIKG
ncbi:ABC transporter permease [Paenibacillus glucanolyticus]|uniref:ABC transporter permease n=1 Tax=Paenibacillus glucanolyticus TaxID=59843 RepID=A0A163JII4_9BACL|nr:MULTISPECIES: carbohydrate ABC transporter permease [Paenibacillus]AWP29935.1 ABC transporter permease [Paenibacillus sp. Cedars]KZS46605.1 ABC transporter permease [Paenibacillus glucanolyticus]MDH6671410.1 raffinose/stachyose/melibiose transport system permease protein [Paenibacillus sp. LBL]MPY15657.1 carbohydrate ABC transporter permease [Paenibacillus glucanolyticus]OMF80054.1 ABC transporter permease [Paenibacillus glucanolyticus]